ncbi:hypothetical protein Tco_1193604, partial [Tanacetum coccineum]
MLIFKACHRSAMLIFSSSFVRPFECRNVRIIKYITTILDIKAQRECRKPWLYCGASVINKRPACDKLMVVILSDIYARDVKLLVRDHVALTHAELKWLFIRPTTTGASSFASVLRGIPENVNNISTVPAMVLADDCVVTRNLNNFVMGEVKDF